MTGSSWYERHPVVVAFDLIGATVRVERGGVVVSGRITETEAYAGVEDLASHAGRLRTGRAALFGEVGHLYMYRSYGIHTMLNVVAHERDTAGAVLIRALDPIEGLSTMMARRSLSDVRKLTVGPGVLCQALGLVLGDDGRAVWSDDGVRFLGDDWEGDRRSIMAGPRIGITRSVGYRWRFFEADSRFVSGHRRGEIVRRDMLEDVIADGSTQG